MKGRSIRGKKRLAFCRRFFAFAFLSDGGSFLAISNLFSRFEKQLKAHAWRRRHKYLNDRNRKGEKRLLQRTQVFLPRIDLPFMTFILLFALKTHTALFRRAKKRFPHTAHSEVLFLSFQGWERRDFRCKKHCSGKRRKRTKASAEVIARWAHAKAKSGGDKMRCRKVRAVAYVVCFRAANLGCPCFGLLRNGARTGALRKVPVKSVPGNPGSGAPNQSETL